MAATTDDIKARHLFEKFILLFPSWEGKVVRYKRKDDVLILLTTSNNSLYFWLENGGWVLTTEHKQTKMKGVNTWVTL